MISHLQLRHTLCYQRDVEEGPLNNVPLSMVILLSIVLHSTPVCIWLHLVGYTFMTSDFDAPYALGIASIRAKVKAGIVCTAGHFGSVAQNAIPRVVCLQNLQ